MVYTDYLFMSASDADRKEAVSRIPQRRGPGHEHDMLSPDEIGAELQYMYYQRAGETAKLKNIVFSPESIKKIDPDSMKEISDIVRRHQQNASQPSTTPDENTPDETMDR